jgi:hypothetical protein
MARTILEQALSRCINLVRNATIIQMAIITIRISSNMVIILMVHRTTRYLLARKHEQRVATSLIERSSFRHHAIIRR